ncbi:LPXTG cell wall anchor domain-containing protein [Lacticaseibacillus brantae]|uniref:Gram-positive cocci surface proteins LPxTG domain-containing protein n=1 Tax=Lacticaseibacillus brantae DSM 23927 TaxID=1423727 RepID=A0A0R2AYJ3_9LACO|nr:LPXTG cell wall anchor domain-containing protein [Lacticaseibacillus brantae]KRM71834.1 hypothetical protein FC34_GL001495 [Lacticaseibacillus brantae DSM 23927]
MFYNVGGNQWIAAHSVTLHGGKLIITNTSASTVQASNTSAPVTKSSNVAVNAEDSSALPETGDEQQAGMSVMGTILLGLMGLGSNVGLKGKERQD